MKLSIFCVRIAALFTAFFLVGCAFQYRGAPYSVVAYQQATSLKVDALALMAKAGEPYEQHSKEIDTLKLNLAKAQEYARGRKKNDVSVRMWEILLYPDGHLLGGFFERWQHEGTLSKTFVREAIYQVGEAFDLIIGIESGKVDVGKGELPPRL